MKNEWTKRIEKLEAEKKELLEACKYAMGCIDGDIRDYKDNLPKLLRNAIKKAEGGETDGNGE